MRAVVGALGLLWALANVLLAYFMVTSAFVAKTAAKEGILAQLTLFVGGLVIAAFALLLARQCVRLIVTRHAASS